MNESKRNQIIFTQYYHMFLPFFPYHGKKKEATYVCYNYLFFQNMFSDQHPFVLIILESQNGKQNEYFFHRIYFIYLSDRHHFEINHYGSPRRMEGT